MQPEADRLLHSADAARREGRPGEALKAARRAVAQLREEGTPLDLVRGLRCQGECARRAADAPLALASYEEAVNLLRSAGESLLLAHTLRHLGDVHAEAGRVERAEPCYREALARYRAADPPDLELANALRSLAVLLESSDPAQAIQVWTEARERYGLAGVPSGIDEAKARVANLQARDSEREEL